MRAALLLLSLLLGSCEQEAKPVRSEASRPELALLTSLPIVFSESFSLDASRNPLLARLEQGYAVRPVDGPEQLVTGGLLLAIQPQALTAERLVQLDRWVRNGGRLVLLADARLTFESSRPLGDRFRPPFSFPDSGLLRHWGLELEDVPAGQDEDVTIHLGGGADGKGNSVGRLRALGRGGCVVTEGGHAARCRIGRGRVTVVADADFAMSSSTDNHQAVLALLDEMERPARVTS